ncbi:MAG: queuosine precursor transporter, partial [Bacillota bacterium]|nr:queuosine precursor transporter [Bacillota bacterium]
MPNEILLFINLLVVYSAVLVAYKFCGIQGLTFFIVFATIAANIEVLILINAFGLEQTLGNIVFAATFLATDIICETGSKKQAHRAVNLGIAATVFFVLLSQIWLLYTPSPNDWAMPHMKAIFTNTGRTMVVSVLVYDIV